MIVRKLSTTYLPSVIAHRYQFARFAPLSTSAGLRNEEDLKVFKDNATKWWDGSEFSILKSMNKIRVPFIADGLGKPMQEAKIIDVGCGGGLLSEPLARLGANVLGIDPVFESINQALIHSQADPDLKDRLSYRNCNIEDLSALPEHKEAYDALVASEVVEHIRDIESFLIHCTKLIKPNGSLFITTINQTPLSWLGVIFFGEYVLKQIPKGTHTYDMLVSVKGLCVMLERLGYHIKLVNGFMYEPIGGEFYWTPTTLTHYALQAVKTTPSAKGINYEQRRHMSSKAKKMSRPKVVLDQEEISAVLDIDAYTAKADAIVAELKEHLDKHLSTRASTGSLETLRVTIEGLDEPFLLRDIATLNMKGSNLIVINLSSMPEALKPTVQAIKEATNLDAQVEVNNVYVPVPKVTREHREKLVASAKQTASLAKSEIKALFSQYSSKAKSKQAEGKKGVSKDLIHAVVENLRFDMDRRVDEIEQVLKSRADQLLNR